jgi:hypothetical protein
VLVPEIAGGAAAELDDLRTACDEAISTLLGARPRSLVIVGSGPATVEYPHPFHISFARYGLPGSPSALPLSITVGVWLLNRFGPVAVPLRAYAVAADAPVAECVSLGARLAAEESVGLLVMGDGSACRTEKAPGYLDPRAEAFDATVTKALAEVDAPALRALDPDLAAELLVAGRAPWQVLAAAARPGLSGDVRYDAAPYGVNYTVAVWT